MGKPVHKKRLGPLVKQRRDMLSGPKKSKKEDREKKAIELSVEEEIARALKDSRVGDDW